MSAPTTRSKRDKTSRKKSSTAKKINLVGRRVLMCADMFGGKEDEYYNGLVVRKSRYTQRGKVRNGFQVKWHNGDVDYW